MSNGPKFWDSLCGPRNGRYPEYVSPDNWLGEYVSKLEEAKEASPPWSKVYQGEALSGSSGSRDAPTKAGSGSSGSQAPAKLPRWKRRTSEQIEANKAAQKRFREKKKAKLTEATAKVEELSAQMKSLETLNSEVDSVQQQNEALEASLWSKEAELNEIRMELDEKSPQAVYDSKVAASCIPSFISNPSSLDARIQKVAARWLREKEGLQQLLETQGLHPQQAPAVSAAQVRQIEKRSLAVMAQCMEIMTLGGPQMDVLLRTLADRNEDLLRGGSTEKYVGLARSLNLSPEQVQSALQTRTDVMNRLERVYDERQSLNMRVLALLMAGSQPSTQPDVSSDAAKRAAELRRTLAELQSNLAEEQRLESEHHHAIFRKILTSLQGAHFIVAAYPSHCDTLAFMHGIAQLQSQASWN